MGRVEERRVDAGGIGDTTRLEDDVLDRFVAVEQLGDGVDEIVTDLAAHAAVGEADHAVLDVDDEFGVDVDRSEVVDEHPDLATRDRR